MASKSKNRLCKLGYIYSQCLYTMTTVHVGKEELSDVLLVIALDKTKGEEIVDADEAG